MNSIDRIVLAACGCLVLIACPPDLLELMLVLGLIFTGIHALCVSLKKKP